MMQGYYNAKHDYNVVCDMFFRSAPHGGYIVFSGLDPLLDTISNLHFKKEDIDFLHSTKQFTKSFLDHLSHFRFRGTIYAVPEGTVCFPNEPLIRVHAPVAEAQLIEGLILNFINYSSYISTKTARMSYAAKGKKIFEMGLRRAPGPSGAMLASRAAYIGGTSATSNVAACKEFSIPYIGTMSHSWIMNFENEIEAFNTYARMYPDMSVFLLDTYNTISSGLPAAIQVGKMLQKQGKNFGVRLDSGDIDYLSHAVRKGLNKAGLTEAFIVASNNLDEYIISDLTANNCPVDSWGIGTKLVANSIEESLSGVYKLSAKETIDSDTGNKRIQPLLKLSNNIEKNSLPGIKQIYRCYQQTNTNRSYVADVVVHEHTTDVPTNTSFSLQTVYHPYLDTRKFQLPNNIQAFPLLACVLHKGQKKLHTSLSSIKQQVANNFICLDHSYKRLLNPHLYKVSINKTLKELRDILIEKREKSYKEL